MRCTIAIAFAVVIVLASCRTGYTPTARKFPRAPKPVAAVKPAKPVEPASPAKPAKPARPVKSAESSTGHGAELAGFFEVLAEKAPPSPWKEPPFPVWKLRDPVTLVGGGDKFSAPGLLSDPDTKLVDGTWHLFVSIGDPAGRLGPNVHHTMASDPSGPFVDTKWRRGSWPRVILDPRDASARESGDTYRCETISVEVLPDGGAVALYCGTPGLAGRVPGRQDWFIYRATAASIGARHWERDGSCMARDLPWEMGWIENNQLRGKLAESGLFWHRGHLCSVYAAQNRRGWRLGLAASPDHGRTWLKKPEPILEPGSGYGMVSHGNVAALNNGWYLLTYIEGGKGGHRRNGIAQAMTRDPWNEPWIEDPSNPVIRDVDVGISGAAKGHIGSPTVEEDPANDRLVMHFHKKSENPPGHDGPRLRGRVLWAESDRPDAPAVTGK